MLILGFIKAFIRVLQIFIIKDRQPRKLKSFLVFLSHFSLCRYVEYCLSKIRMLQRYKINPILVFDGGPLPMKAYREEQRAQRRSESKKKADEFMTLNSHSTAKLSTSAYSHMSKSADVTPEMAFMLIEALRRERVEYIVAPYEADAQLAYLDRIGRVSAVISEDSDLLLFGIKRILFKMDKFGNAEEVCLDRLGSCSEIDLREFTLIKVCPD